jgi:hypothetical protein
VAPVSGRSIVKTSAFLGAMFEPTEVRIRKCIPKKAAAGDEMSKTGLAGGNFHSDSTECSLQLP